MADLDQWGMAFAELAVIDALTTANRRLLRRHGRSVRNHNNQLRQTDARVWHTILPTNGIDIDDLLDGTFTVVDEASDGAVGAGCMRSTLVSYVAGLIATGTEHTREALTEAVAEAGCLPAAA
jgi:hypothetical protein